MRPTTWALLGLLILLLLGLPVIFKPIADRLLFYPEQGQSRSPSDVGLEFEEAILSRDGLEVELWWIPGQRDRPVLIMFHGNAGTMADRLDNAALLVERLGVGLVMVEYPGYGNSTGKPSEKALYAAADLGYGHARRVAGARPLIAFGRSLGGAVAIELAARYPLDGLIAESTFTSLADMGRAIGMPAFLARRASPYRFDSIHKMPQIHCPLLISHGDMDEIVPFPMGEALFAAAGAQHKHFHRVVDGDHNGIWVTGGAPYWEAWRRFVDEVANRAEDAPSADPHRP